MDEQTIRPGRRAPLDRERVLRAAMAVADGGGLADLTIRSLAASLGVKPMSVYHHVAGKDEILDGIVDLVFAEIDLPEPGREWRGEMVRRARSARAVLVRHPWAVALLESRTSPGPATLRHHDATIGTLRAGGFPVPLTAHAFALLDSFIYGFVIQEAAQPLRAPEETTAATEAIMAGFAAGEYPHLVEMATEHILRPGYAFGDEFEYGLTAVLDALAAALAGSR
ncbi:TetR/AcrR family transcriptional regulator C-terminal domain-containing protein [Dactylosporangium sp. NPDC051485]|uniref:TetR/AcrR family transcriptional regulator n=1 Tax=Dactylosporangium sp. NPDC051485 TaxID=3154846 RepID=UPI00343C8ABA